jgi:hypothetical protein
MIIRNTLLFQNYMKYVNGRRTGLVTLCGETAFHNRKDKRRDTSDGKTRKKT